MNLTTEFNLTHAEFLRLSELVHRHCGINMHDGKKQLVQARIAKCLGAGGFDSVEAYLDHIDRDPGGVEFTRLIDAMSTNLTSFYRESDHFRFLAETVVPDLLRRKRRAGDCRLRMWSAACSTGEEPYTLGMVLLDAIPDAPRWNLKILATDISTRVLATARGGVYPGERVAPLPAPLVSRFFAPRTLHGDRVYEVTPELRELIAFRHLNLIEPWPFNGTFDVIFCRNVMIYFDKPTQERLVNRFAEALEPGGLLFTGHSESLTGVRHALGYVRPTVYRKD